jgi:hypothetical protein
MSFRGLFVRAIDFGNDHVKHDGEGFHYHHAHTVMVMTFEAKGCVTWCPKRLQDEDHTYISGSMDEGITMSSQCFHEPQQKTIRYIWIFRSSMKSTFQWIKREGNWRFLQVDMAESPMVAHAEIMDSKQCWSVTAIALSFGLQLRRMSTRWKDNFIKFSIELYFGIFSVLDAGLNPRRRVRNKVMTTIKRRWGNCSTTHTWWNSEAKD